jgi:hypothetical protein
MGMKPGLFPDPLAHRRLCIVSVLEFGWAAAGIDICQRDHRVVLPNKQTLCIALQPVSGWKPAIFRYERQLRHLPRRFPLDVFSQNSLEGFFRRSFDDY